MKKNKLIRVLFVLNILLLIYGIRLSKHKNKPLETLKISKEDIQLNNGIQQGKHEPFNYDIK